MPRRNDNYYPGGGYGYDDQGRIADLIMQGGDIAARQALSSGDIWGRAFQNIGNIASQGFGQYFQAKEEEKQKKELEAKQTTRSLAVDAALNSGDPRAILKVLGPADGAKVIDALKTHTPDASKVYGDRMEVYKKNAQGLRALPAGSRDKAYAQMRASLASQYPEAAQELPEAYDDDLVTRVASYGEKEKEVKAPELTKVTVMGPEGKPIVKGFTQEQLAAGVPEYVKPEAPKEAKPEWGQPFTGPDGASYQQSSKTGEIRRTPGVGAKPAEGAAKEPTAEEKKAAGFYNRAAKADTILAKLEQESRGQPGYLENWTPERLLGEDRKEYLQAQRDFTIAHLRPESGASISKEEFELDAKTYFPQYGDSPQRIAQKAAARREILEGIKTQAGRAYNADPFGLLSAGGGGGKGNDPMGLR